MTKRRPGLVNSPGLVAQSEIRFDTRVRVYGCTHGPAGRHDVRKGEKAPPSLAERLSSELLLTSNSQSLLYDK